MTKLTLSTHKNNGGHMLTTRDPDLFKKEADRQIDLYQQRTAEVLRRLIRESFDNAIVDSSASAWIVIAIQYGFEDLATEMRSDLMDRKEENV